MSSVCKKQKKKVDNTKRELHTHIYTRAHRLTQTHMYMDIPKIDRSNLQCSYISIGIHPAKPNNENNLVSFRKFAAQATAMATVLVCV